MDPALRLHPEQQALTPAQEAETRRFVEAYIQTQLATEPVDEQEAEAFLRHMYAAVGLDPPPQIFWLDGPRQLDALLSSDDEWPSAADRHVHLPEAVWERLKDHDEIGPITPDVCSLRSSINTTITSTLQESAEATLPDDFKPRYGTNVGWFIALEVRWEIGERVRDRVGWRLWEGLGGFPSRWSDQHRIRDHFDISLEYVRWSSIRAYDEADELACLHFYETYLAPNAAHSLVHFNQLVSGYWLGKAVALVVRRPNVLTLDEAGRLHCATGKAMEYRDGWGFYAWHGVEVSERVILAPERLTREDFLRERNLEVRRIIQERMGSRFVWELEGKYIDGGPPGVLYEVELPGDPERVARYVQVQDASTDRYYFLRVPPTIQTAAEAVAWSFNLSVQEYHPTGET
jgi:hypothetical protein